MTLVPELYISSLSQSLAFYVGLLGFKIDYQRAEHGFAAISLENGRLMLEAFTSSDEASNDEFQQGHWRTGKFEYPLGRGINFEFTISDIEPAYQRLKAANYPLKLDLHNRQYRVNYRLIEVRQFLVLDPDGYLIRLAQEVP